MKHSNDLTPVLFAMSLALAGCSGGQGDDPIDDAIHPDDTLDAVDPLGAAPDGGTPLTVSGLFAGPQSSGSMALTLRPTEAVSPGQPTLVTFGVPFPRGSLSDAKQIRVLTKDGAEVPAHVDVASPWRSITNPALDGASIRVARVQIRYTFSAAYPGSETLTLQWGVPRQSDVASGQPARTGWHTVQGGTYVAADGVKEPDVYVLLPSDWLSKSGLSMPMNVQDSSVAEARQDPNAFRAATFTGYAMYDQAAIDFLYTELNQDDPAVTQDNLIPYKTDSEPWLYDRAGTFFQGYLRSGYFTQLREAVRAADFYRQHVYRPDTPGLAARNAGMFDLKVTDKNDWPGGNGAMYSYAEPLAFSYWLTGDDAPLEYLPWICDAQDQGEPTRWSASLTEWTERHTAFHLLSYVYAYEVTGEQRYRDKITSMVGDFIWHQDGADGAFPSGTIDGGLWHTGAQHGDGTGIIASPWMSALTVNAMLRAYLVTEDPRIPTFIIRMGRFEKAATKMWDKEHQIYDTELTLPAPDYVTSFDGTTNEHDDADEEHAMDAAAVLAWAGYFSDVAGSPDPSFRQLATALYQTYQVGTLYFTRPAGPASGKSAYRVSPPRKYGWQYHNTGAFGRLMSP